MKKKKFVAYALVYTLVMGNASTAFAATIGTYHDASARGTWSDTNNLTWKWWDGSGIIVIGSGPRFCDVYPEITDPEYFLKENLRYPGEEVAASNSQGQPKADYTAGTLPLLQEFVNSFDWIHSDEVTRLQKVHDRIGNGRNGNADQHTKGGAWNASFNVLQNKKGNCGNYSWEFAKLCKYIGLECVTYVIGANHAACLVNINGQWLVVDPFSKDNLFNNIITVPVDFDKEYYRYDNEARNSAAYKAVMERAEDQRKAEAGEISWAEYYQRGYPKLTIEEIKTLYRNNGIELDI